jgi:hypothetical protein
VNEALKTMPLVVALALLGCDEKKEDKKAPPTPADAGAPLSPPPPPPPPTPSTSASATPDAAAEVKHFDPKHKCPTGQTHFYMEGDFCRRKCVTTADCGKKERCSSMDYPYVLDGGTAGTSRFCEGT